MLKFQKTRVGLENPKTGREEEHNTEMAADPNQQVGSNLIVVVHSVTVLEKGHCLGRHLVLKDLVQKNRKCLEFVTFVVFLVYR